MEHYPSKNSLYLALLNTDVEFALQNKSRERYFHKLGYGLYSCTFFKLSCHSIKLIGYLQLQVISTCVHHANIATCPNRFLTHFIGSVGEMAQSVKEEYCYKLSNNFLDKLGKAEDYIHIK